MKRINNENQIGESWISIEIIGGSGPIIRKRSWTFRDRRYPFYLISIGAITPPTAVITVHHPVKLDSEMQACRTYLCRKSPGRGEHERKIIALCDYLRVGNNYSPDHRFYLDIVDGDQFSFGYKIFDYEKDK